MPTRLTIILVLFLAVIVALSGLNAVSAQETDAREQFRAFYEPLLPRLKESYSNVSFRGAFVTPMEAVFQVKPFDGEIQNGSNFVFDRYKTTWIQSRNLSTNALEQTFANLDQPENSGGWIDDYSFGVTYRPRGNVLDVNHDEYRESIDFEPCILTPIASIQLRRTFESILNDNDILFFDFVDRRLRDGRQVKTLFYRPSRSSKEFLFEADFDPETGVCLSSQEIEPDDPEYVYVMRATYRDENSAEDSDLLPPLQAVDGNFINMKSMVVLDYDRVSPSEQGEFSVARYGFDPAEAERPMSAIGKVAGSANNFLIVAGLVLLLLFIFVVFLMFVISSWAKKNVKPPAASDVQTSPPPETPSDLSQTD